MRQALSFTSALAAFVLLQSTASAGTFVDLTLLGSTSATGPYTSSLTVNAGETIYYEVEVELAPVGTVDGTHTIKSKVNGTDGVNSLSLNLTGVGSIPVTFTTPTVATSWSGISAGLSAGTPSTDGVNGIRVGQAPGVYTGANSESIVLTGSFTTGSSLAHNLNSVITMDFNGATSGFRYNDGTTAFMTSSSEGGANPYAGYVGLTLTTAASVPEPASAVLLGLSAIIVGGFMAAKLRKTTISRP
jgi:hypothetical protein